MLGGEVTGHQGRTRRRAHASVGERVLEGETISLQTGQAREIIPFPIDRKMLDRTFLVGNEQDDVLSKNLA